MKKVMYNNSELSGSFGQENTPVGTILMYGGTTLPFGYMWCNGSAVSRTVYADLFNAIGTAFGSGDGSTTFNLPDWRERDQTCNYIIKFCKAISPTQEQFIDDSTVSAEKTWSSEKIQSSTSIIVHSVVLKTTLSGTTTVSTYNGRKLSDYKLLLFSIGTNDSIRETTIIPSNTFNSYSVHVSANHNTGLSQISGVQFIYVDDTHIRCELAGSEVLNTVYVEAIK